MAEQKKQFQVWAEAALSVVGSNGMADEQVIPTWPAGIEGPELTVGAVRAALAALSHAEDGAQDRRIVSAMAADLGRIAEQLGLDPDDGGAAPTAPAGEQDPDDTAVDRFAAAMKAKLAKKRAEGRSGWDDKGRCSQEFLSRLLRDHVGKGDPVDVANLAMMLHERGEVIQQPVSDPDGVPSWADAEEIHGRPEVFEALFNFSHDSTSDNAINVVQTIVQAARAPAPDEREIAARALEDAAQAAKKEADETSSPDNALALSYCIGFCRSRAERLRAGKEGEQS